MYEHTFENMSHSAETFQISKLDEQMIIKFLNLWFPCYLHYLFKYTFHQNKLLLQ